VNPQIIFSSYTTFNYTSNSNKCSFRV